MSLSSEETANWLVVFPGVAVCVCILLLCINEVLCAPREGNTDMWAIPSGQEIRGPAIKSSSIPNMFNSLSTSMEHDVVGTYPVEKDMHHLSDNLHQEVLDYVINFNENEQEEQGEHLFKPKRESRVQVRSTSTSRARTGLRIQAPCAGTNLHSRSGSNPFAASMEISPRSLLQSLANEAVAVQKLAQNVLRRMESEGVSQQVALVLEQEAVLQSGLGSQAHSPVSDDQVSLFGRLYIGYTNDKNDLMYLSTLTSSKPCHIAIVVEEIFTSILYPS